MLDLEAALSAAEGGPHLDPRYDSGDGLHLNAQASPILDRDVMDSLE